MVYNAAPKTQTTHTHALLPNSLRAFISQIQNIPQPPKLPGSDFAHLIPFLTLKKPHSLSSFTLTLTNFTSNFDNWGSIRIRVWHGEPDLVLKLRTLDLGVAGFCWMEEPACGSEVKIGACFGLNLVCMWD